MRRPKPDITKYDLTFPCSHCGYKIPPRELMRIDGEHVRCPKCGKEIVYGKESNT
jgi:DNA-directed RNA polymerase subunit RPC12/RpoP